MDYPLLQSGLGMHSKFQFTRWLSILVLLCFINLVSAQIPSQQATPAQWAKLQQHPIPEWFKDAKLGIYAHLGVYSVPAFETEWYPHHMYNFQKDGSPSKVMAHHIATYGPLDKFGYKDFIPMFTAEKFNAEVWADLYQKAGAKFGGIVTVHHDGYAMWHSKVNRWNAVQTGPKRDLYGEMVTALRKRDIKILATFHHAKTFRDWYNPKNKTADLDDPAYADFYGRMDSAKANKRWLDQLKEVIDNYQPDQIWFDFDLKFIPDIWKYRFANYYYKKEKEWNKPVIITRKQNHLLEGVGILDVERGKQEKPSDTLWQTDDAVALKSWTWVKGLQLKPTAEIIHEFVDIVSKNGVLLLNICPKADGSIPDDQQQILLALGKFLQINGNAIYNSRPFAIHGEGPNLYDRGRGFNNTEQPPKVFTAQDIRYTQSKDGSKIYVFTLGWPKKELIAKAINAHSLNGKKIKSIRLLGANGNALWKQTTEGIVIQTNNSDRPKDQFAYSWEVNLQ